MKRSFSIFALLSLLCLNTTYAQVETNWTGYQNEGGAHYFDPVEFFKGVPEFFPEMQNINSHRYPQLNAMAEYLKQAGVPVMIGNEAELDSFFDLYMPTIARSPYLDAVPLGINKEAEVGKLYLLHHDFAHHFAGIPGIRAKDLANPEATRSLIKDIVLWKEVFATAQSSLWYISKYWEWRENPSPEKLEDFRRYAQGYYSGVSPLTPAEHVEVLEYFIFGKTRDYISFLSKKLTPSSIQKTRELGVPRVIPDFSKVLGNRLDATLMSYVTRLAEPIHSYFRPVGHKNFVKYCEEYADLLMQPWYVQWSEDFEVGIPLEQLHQRTLDLVQQMREGKEIVSSTIGMPKNYQSWEFSFLKTEIRLLGRKMREVINAAPNPEMRNKLESEYQRIVKVYKSTQSESNFIIARTRFLELLDHLDKNVSIDDYVPWSYRSRDASYIGFWRNPYAIIWQRGDALKNANAPRLSSKKLQSLYDYGSKRKELTPIQNEVLKSYQNFINNPSHSNEKSITESEQTRYQNTIRNFVKKALLPQFPYFALNTNAKFKLENQVKSILEKLEFQWKMRFSNETLPLISQYSIIDHFAEVTQQFILSSRSLKKGSAEEAAIKYSNELDTISSQLNGNTSELPRHFNYTRPPGFYRPELIDQIVDIITPYLDPKSKLPKLSSNQNYISIADWVNTNKIADCDRIMKGNP